MTRKAALLFFAVTLVVIFLPAAVVSLGHYPGAPQRSAKKPSDDQNEITKAALKQIHLYRADQKKITAMELEEYLVGVLLAEMPSTFETEALKAQAVIARTYALHQVRSLGGSGCDRGPAPADICSDSTHCQAWLDPAEAAAKWGPESEPFIERVRQAVTDTSGEVAVYQGRLIEAVYHSTCGGKTEASHALWSGGSLPYLQSVSCPYCAHSPYYRGERLIPFTQLAAAVAPDLTLPVASSEQLPLEIVSKTRGGRVAAIKINDTLIEGKELRRLLELPSTAFNWELKDEGLLFLTRGQGHGVGLCQYGADGAAREGKNYRQIIMFYYPGTEVTTFQP